MNYQKLFDHLSKEHNLDLVESELREIVVIVQEMERTYLCEFIHPQFGEQHTERNTIKEIIDWASYMIEYHEITNVRFFEVIDDIKREILIPIPNF